MSCLVGCLAPLDVAPEDDEPASSAQGADSLNLPQSVGDVGDLVLLLAAADSDNDGLSDADEMEMGLDPDDPTDGPDRDGDGTPNEEDADVDGDGIINEDDPDIDGDAVFNGFDFDIDGDHVANALDLDMDGDGIPNRWDIDIDADLVFNDEEPEDDPNDTDENPIEELAAAGKEALSRVLANKDCGPLVNDCQALVRKIVEQLNDRIVQTFAPADVKEQVNSSMTQIIQAARNRGESEASDDEGLDALLQPDQPMFNGLDAALSNLFDAFKENGENPLEAAQDFGARVEAIATISLVHGDANMSVVGDKVRQLRDRFEVEEMDAVTEFVGSNAKERDLKFENAVAALDTAKQAFKNEDAADITMAMNDAMDSHFGGLNARQKQMALLNMAKGAFDAHEEDESISLADAIDAAAKSAADKERNAMAQPAGEEMPDEQEPGASGES
jgi:hypothetical protein